MSEATVVIPNWNGKDSLAECIDSLAAQSHAATIVLVDNGSIDGSVEFVQKRYPEVTLVVHEKNLGFAGGVNSGINKAMENGSKYIALFNNDAVADKDWLRVLVETANNDANLGIVTCKLIKQTKKQLDSTGDQYTNWGLPYPRGRDEVNLNKYDPETVVFGASGGASLYRVKMLQEIGLFDSDFFAYYEDIDLSFRAQLSGWKVAYEPKASAYHKIGATSAKIKGFTTYQTMKNLPWLFWKNVPSKYLFRVGSRFSLAYFAFFISAIKRGQGWSASRGALISLIFIPKKSLQRHSIQTGRTVTPEYIWSMMTHDLPPNAHKLRSLRNKWWHLTGKI